MSAWAKETRFTRTIIYPFNQPTKQTTNCYFKLSLIIKRSPPLNDFILYVLIYVDDTIITVSSGTTVLQLIKILQSEFAIKDLGPLHYFLGMEATRDLAGLFLNQSKYVHDLLRKYNMENAKPYHLQWHPGCNFLIIKKNHLPIPHPTTSLVGALQYLTITRPNISFPVNRVVNLCIHQLIIISQLQKESCDI